MHLPDHSTAGMLTSLSFATDNPSSPLSRRARRLAAHLSRHPRDRALQRRAADLTAALLDAADCGLALEADGLLCEEFDD
jgi:hypothetical protein